jgi:cytochrome oxidase Cu insertion factor (SCO1/SenC/PrrC family)
MPPSWSRLLPSVAAMATTALLSAQPTGPTRAEIDAAGPKVGRPALDFSLQDQHGERHTLKSSLGPKGLVLVFFRSADW